MALLAMAIPIAPGKTDHFKRFLKELTENRWAEFVASRKKLNVHERSFLQQTPHGDLAVVTIEGPDPAGAFAGFGKQNDAFAEWFKQQVKEIHGIDLSATPPPMPTLVVDSQR
jgi:hypothetical protein